MLATRLQLGVLLVSWKHSHDVDHLGDEGCGDIGASHHRGSPRVRPALVVLAVLSQRVVSASGSGRLVVVVGGAPFALSPPDAEVRAVRAPPVAPGVPPDLFPGTEALTDDSLEGEPEVFAE